MDVVLPSIAFEALWLSLLSAVALTGTMSVNVSADAGLESHKIARRDIMQHAKTSGAMIRIIRVLPLPIPSTKANQRCGAKSFHAAVI